MRSHFESEKDEYGFKVGMSHKVREFRKKAVKERGQLRDLVDISHEKNVGVTLMVFLRLTFRCIRLYLPRKEVSDNDST